MKRLVVCCDGTWNRPDEVQGPTNVAKFGLGVAEADGAVEQRVYYHKGVGTDRFERMRGGAFGYGLSRHVRDCYRFVVTNYEPGDELYFLGFSRGAFTARSTVGLVRNAGILRADHVDRIDEAYRLYRGRGDEAHPNGVESELFRRMYSYDEVGIHFVGVWDTVGSLGVPGFHMSLARRLWGFHDTALSSHVRFAYHALAIDEQRGPFAPTLWQQQEQAAGQTLEQVWFAGVHSDVGGGYAEPALAELALLWLAGRAQACGLALRPDHFTKVVGAIDDGQRRLGVQVAPDALGDIHNSRKGLFALLPRRPRTLTAPDGNANLTAASTALRRRVERRDYAPANLEALVDAGGRETDVEAAP